MRNRKYQHTGVALSVNLHGGNDCAWTILDTILATFAKLTMPKIAVTDDESWEGLRKGHDRLSTAPVGAPLAWRFGSPHCAQPLLGQLSSQPYFAITALQARILLGGYQHNDAASHRG